mmetsp:Transcript_22971/g.44782  ORF Transcript_22971/g.44782 Transcript_22971/m.44782 type:complete len:876 (-) Transcript_22971:153-2780(-)|eukprot:CAMPEP_0167800112 /NCGR_PEP_ID=MMETSP0111_2-20121227/17523_1 /TAXON_ID=91324 /ORGANISM="Lotharella globosa, Strain CCCM811" /LENGTH=875 /DNA_ID=CAMNT_0007695281 /DNA_START=92 /DNA_END=2719 /DNA_ORIENTATION=-
MRFHIDNLLVYFPYDYVYPEQYDYMRYLKMTLDGVKGHCLLEMPTGTGKTVSLLSLILSYQLQDPTTGKLVYCTRTVQEMDKVVEELRRVMKFIQEEVKKDAHLKQEHHQQHHANKSGGDGKKKSQLLMDIEAIGGLGAKGGNTTATPSLASVGVEGMLGVCLSSRRNMCIHPAVSSFDNRNKVDALCRNLTAPFVRERGNPEELCSYYEAYSKTGSDAQLAGIYSLHDMMILGNDKGWCPYYMARYMINRANVVVYNYQYMLDPKISGMVSREIEKESIVVFDEAHNIDNVCIEALSVTLNNHILRKCSENIRKLENDLKKVEASDAKRLQDEYQSLVSGLFLGNNNNNNSSSSSRGGGDQKRGEGGLMMGTPVLSKDILQEAMPGNIRRGRHFLQYLRILVEYIKSKLNDTEVSCQFPGQFMNGLTLGTRTGGIVGDPKGMRFCYSRLNSLLKTLEVTDLDEYTPIQLLANFVTLLATYTKGFRVLMEPHDDRTPHIKDPKLQLTCVDASIAIKPVFERFRNVIITSGTLSPLPFYTKILNFTPKLSEALTMKLSKKCILPLIVTKGSDQVPMSSKFEMRNDANCLKNYGQLLVELCAVVPDGIVCFFTSYEYMEQVVSEWGNKGGRKQPSILQQILKNKLIFIETKDVAETSMALDAFKKACDCGRGAVFFSIARGKVSEGIDFNNHYGRCVVMFGIPYQFTKSRVLLLRMDFLQTNYGVQDREFITFDAIRQTSQCVGRVIRSKMDYGIMIFADVRYSKADKVKKLPQWITHYLDPKHHNLSTDRAVYTVKQFLREMGQPRSLQAEIGETMLTREQVEKRARALGLGKKFAGGFQSEAESKGPPRLEPMAGAGRDEKHADDEAAGMEMELM